MSWQAITKSFELADGRSISIETGKLARQANGAVVVRMGKAALLATVVSNTEMREGMNFFPLSVDYQEKFASAGRIPGSFHRREGRLSTYEILICRLIDRALRPLFPDGYYYETQVLISLISSDPEVMPDALAGLAASSAIAVSDIPFNGPMSEVRVARIDGEYVVNPKKSDLERADMDIILAATEENVNMVEGECHECSEEELVEAIRIGHEAIKVQCQIQRELAEACGKTEKREWESALQEDEELYQKVEAFAKDRVYEIAKNFWDKHERRDAMTTVKNEMVEAMEAELTAANEALAEGEEAVSVDDTIKLAKDFFDKVKKKVVRNMVLDEQVRLDGRKLNEVRPLHMEVDLLATPHGSSLFCRGETQSLTTVTLGPKKDEQLIDKAAGVEFERFMLHYNFPPFSTGEARPIRGTSRREIGHGNLAKRSLEQVLPEGENNPYTVRVVSDILESNGSSSMATVCAGSLALMDAGVQMKTGVSGIAMGMITSEDGRVAILSDILGDEDHLGDMDFKVTGTKNGICAVQMDIKVDGLPYEVLTKALYQAKEGRTHILEQMNQVIEAPREEPKPQAPRIETMIIAGEFIGAVIGPGGKVIQEMQRETDTIISIEELPDGRGSVQIFANDKDSVEKAKNRIKLIVVQPEVGTVYDAVVKSVTNYGAFVEFLPGKQGLLHISEISWKRLASMDGVLEEGDVVKVKLLDVDKRSGKFKLSKKALEPSPYGDGDGGRDNRGRGGNRGGGRGNYNRGGGGNRNRRN